MMMILFIILTIIFIAILVKSANQKGEKEVTSLDILRKRYEEKEISKKEYEEIKKKIIN